MNRRHRLALLLLLSLSCLPALAYEYPLSAGAIREAYFLGTGTKGTDESFYNDYARTIPNPAKEPPVSTITIDTPYLQVAEHARPYPNLLAPDAVEEFFGKPAKFRVFADIYFTPPSDERHSGDKKGSRSDESKSDGRLEIQLKQNQKEIPARIVDESPLYPFRDAQSSAARIGEHVELECDASNLNATALTITVRLPEGQAHKVVFDLSQIK